MNGFEKMRSGEFYDFSDKETTGMPRRNHRRPKHHRRRKRCGEGYTRGFGCGGQSGKGYKETEVILHLYRNKKRIYLFVVSCEAAQTDKSVFIYSPPSNKFLTQDCPVGAAETAAPPKGSLLIG